MSALLTNYLKRIGLPEVEASGFSDRPAEEIVADVEKLLAAHADAIPFENLNPMARLGVSPKLDDVVDKLVLSKRGGYCHEHAPLQRAVMRELGLSSRPYLARVYSDPGATSVGARTHQGSLTAIDGREYVTDPGFGGGTPTAALAIDAPGVEYDTPHGTYRLTRAQEALSEELIADSVFVVEHRGPGRDAFRPLYGFDPQRPVAAEEGDLAMANHFTATSVEGLFLTQLMLARHRVDGEKNTISNRRLKTTTPDNPRGDKRELSSADEFDEALREFFGIEADTEIVRAAWEHLPD